MPIDEAYEPHGKYVALRARAYAKCAIPHENSKENEEKNEDVLHA